MNLTSVKTASDLKLDGITFDCEFRDKVITAVTLTDKSGNIARFTLDNYNFRALVPAQPEKKKVHVVTGTVRVVGTPIREEFDESYEANGRKSELDQSGVCDDAAVKVEELEIPF